MRVDHSANTTRNAPPTIIEMTFVGLRCPASTTHPRGNPPHSMADAVISPPETQRSYCLAEVARPAQKKSTHGDPGGEFLTQAGRGTSLRSTQPAELPQKGPPPAYGGRRHVPARNARVISPQSSSTERFRLRSIVQKIKVHEANFTPGANCAPSFMVRRCGGESEGGPPPSAYLPRRGKFF